MTSRDTSEVTQQAGAYLGFDSMKQLGVFLPSPSPPPLVHCRVTPSIKFASTHLYTWVERGTVRVMCLAQAIVPSNNYAQVKNTTQVPGQGSNSARSIRRRAATAPPNTTRGVDKNKKTMIIS